MQRIKTGNHYMNRYTNPLKLLKTIFLFHNKTETSMKSMSAPLIAIICVLLLAQTASAQCFSKNSRCKKTDYWEVQAGVGLMPTFFKDHAQTLMPPVIVGIDYRMKPSMSLGLQVGTSVSEAPRKRPGESEHSMHRNHYTSVGLRFAAHTTTLDRWDVYGGMSLGYGISQIEVRKIGDEKSLEPIEQFTNKKMYISAFVGSRYAITKHIGAFGELGLGVSLISAGISWRL